jgi:hypothetical protein
VPIIIIIIIIIINVEELAQKRESPNPERERLGQHIESSSVWNIPHCPQVS